MVDKFITKFFRKEDRHFYERGSIKFGTLEEYRKIENAEQMGARFDPKEGVQDQSFDFSGNKFLVPGLINLGAANLIVSNVTATRFANEWIFCSSWGPYSSKLHKSLTSKSTLGYPGDERLTDWATFNLSALMDAVRTELEKHPLFKVKTGQNWLYCRKVAYEKAIEKRYSGMPKFYKEVNGELREYLETIFCKSRFFEPENELRIVARLNSPNIAPRDSPPLFLCSEKILGSVVDMSPG